MLVARSLWRELGLESILDGLVPKTNNVQRPGDSLLRIGCWFWWPIVSVVRAGARIGAMAGSDFVTLGIRSRQAVRKSMCSHFLFLMCADMQVALWLCPAEQYKTRRLVISEIRFCVLLAHRACEQSPRAGEA